MASIDQYGYIMLDSGDDKSPKKKKRRPIIWILIIAIVVFFAYNRITNEEKTSMPKDASYFSSIDFYGMDKDEAIKLITDAGWKAECTNGYWDYPRRDCINSFEIDGVKHTINLYINQGFSDEGYDIKEIGAEIFTSESELRIKCGESTDLLVTAGGNLPEWYLFSFSWMSPEVDISWGEWVDGFSASLTLTGISPSEGYARIYLCDGETDEYIGYTDIYIEIYE